jgi:hypothetical protein
MTHIENIPKPPGSKEYPLIRTVRLVDPRSNPSLIIGIPKQISKMAEIDKGTAFKVWMEQAGQKTRIVFEKI